MNDLGNRHADSPVVIRLADVERGNAKIFFRKCG